jgi:maltose-binding protein MalE
MQRKIVIIALAVVIIVVLAAVALLFAGPAHAEIASVTTDKDLYHSSEVMKMTIAVSSSGNMDNTTVRIDGIRDTYNRTRLSHEIHANLTSGQIIFTYDFELPSCSRCAGLPEGSYPFNVTLVHDNVVISNMTGSVQIAQ